MLALGCGKRETAVEQRSAAVVDVCGHIVLASSEGDHHEGGHEHVSIVAAKGGELASLSSGSISRFPAAVAPDGRSLLILESESLPNGKTRDGLLLLEFTAEGQAIGEPRPIGPRDTALRNPAWAPDGSWIVVESDANSFRDLYRLEIGGDTLLRLTDNPEGNFEPAVSPDGQQIAFASSRDGNAEIYLMSADGGDPRRVTQSHGDDTGPVWSPDGRRLAFASSRDRARGHDVFVLELGTDDPQPLVRDGSRSEPVFARDLAFDPRAELLAFTELVAKRGQATITIVALDSGRVLVRSDAPAVDEQATWSPDGSHLAFARSQSGQSDIFRMARDGSGLERLTPGGVHWLPRWLGPSCARVEHAVVAPSRGG